MSILAEPRRKQKLSVDPQNLSWAKNQDAVGKKMLEKMGWSEGDGLGKNRHGMTSNLKLKANSRGKGLGASATNEYDSTWISHHDDFADLLSALNKNKSDGGSKEEEEKKAKKISLELNSKSLKRRIHYQKFTRAKDITNFDENAKKSVFGKGITNKVAMVDHVVEVKKEVINTPEAEEAEQAVKQNHMVSSVSVGDYFKDKMAAKLAALKGSQYVKIEIKQEQEEYLEETEFYEAEQKVVVKKESVGEISSDEITIIGEKKKNKKRKHAKGSSDSEENASQRSRHDVVFVEEQPEEETVTRKKKKKSKIQEEEIFVEKVGELVEKKKKKSKKAKKEDEDMDFVQSEEILEESSKKKKKKGDYEK